MTTIVLSQDGPPDASFGVQGAANAATADGKSLVADPSIVGSNLQFKGLSSPSGDVVLVDNATTKEIELAVNEATLQHQLLAGSGTLTHAQLDAQTPTVGQKAALIGSDGVAGAGNPFMTSSDPRVPSQGENDALAGSTGTPGSANRYITQQDTRLGDARAPSGSASGDLGGSYPAPTVVALHSGAQQLLVGAIGDGQLLKRVGTNIVSVPDMAVATDLAVGTQTATTLQVTSSTGVDVILPAATGTNAGLFTSSEKTKLSGIEANAAADMTAGEIKSLYEGNADTNAFTDAQETKLAGIAAGATVNAADAFTRARANHTGSQALATISDAGALASLSMVNTAQLAVDSVDNTKLANMAASTIKGRITSSGDPQDLTAVQVRTLLNVENGATADMEPNQIKVAYEANSNTNAFTDDEQTKLAGIEEDATADQTPSEIKVAYEGNANTNPFTDAEKAKVTTVAANAVALTSTPPQPISLSLSSLGTGTTAAKHDHVHLLATGSPVAIGAANAAGAAATVSKSDHVHAHGVHTDPALHALATTGAHGFFSSTDKTKINSVETGAQVTSLARIAAALSAGSSQLSFNGEVLGPIGDGVVNTDAASVGQLFNEGAGVAVKRAVRVATTAAVPNLAQVDVSDFQNQGVTLVEDDRVLIKDNASIDGVEAAHGKRNGIYVVGAVSAGSAAFTRAQDLDDNAAIEPGTTLFVVLGDHAGRRFCLSQTTAIVVDTSVQTWVPADGAANLTPGNGIDIVSDVVSADAHADGSISVTSAGIRIGTLASDGQHGTLGGGSLHALATTSTHGFLSSIDKTKIDALPASVPGLSSVAPQAIDASAGSVGTGTAASRDDHDHQISTAVPITLSLNTAANAVGVGNAIARAGHVHQMPPVATPAALVPGNAGYAGSNDTTVRGDHVHSLPAFGSSANTFCAGNDARLPSVDEKAAMEGTGANSFNAFIVDDDFRLSDDRVPMGSAGGQLSGTYPGPSVVGITESSGPTALSIGAVGQDQMLVRVSGSVVGQAAHNVKVTSGDTTGNYLQNKIAVSGPGLSTSVINPGANEQLQLTIASGAPSSVIVGGANAPGSANSVSHSDHIHSVTKGTPVALAPGNATSSGALSTVAGSDHVHALPSFGTTAGQFCEGNDARLPTTALRAAMAGTVGSPSGTNKYVTDIDPRLADGIMTIANVGTGADVWRDTVSGMSSLRGINAASNKVTVAVNANNIDLDVNEANLSLGSIGGTLAIAKGGTGQTTQTAAFGALAPLTTRGDLIIRDATSDVRLPLGTTGQVLTSNGTDAIWSAPAAVSQSCQAVYNLVDPPGTVLAGPFSADFNTSPSANVTLPRPVRAVFSGGWDGGDIVITGTDARGVFGATDTITATGTGTVNGVKAFVAIVTVENTGTRTAGSVQIETSNTLGLPASGTSVYKMFFDQVAQAIPAQSSANGTFTPSSTITGTEYIEVYYTKSA